MHKQERSCGIAGYKTACWHGKEIIKILDFKAQLAYIFFISKIQFCIKFMEWRFSAACCEEPHESRTQSIYSFTKSQSLIKNASWKKTEAVSFPHGFTERSISK